MGTEAEVRFLLDAAHGWDRLLQNHKILPNSLVSHANRVFVGAALSTIDLLTDIYITYTFWKDGKDFFFKCSIAMLASSMLLMVRRERLYLVVVHAVTCC